MRLARALSWMMASLVYGCGPGVTDGEVPLSNGYVLSDAGGNEKAISYVYGKKLGPFVIDARVDSYVVDGKKIIVARRPAESVMRNGVTDVKLLSTCEYWTIDTETHAVEQIADASKWPSIRCDMGKTYGALVERAR